MLQLHCTKALAQDLQSHLVEVPVEAGAMQWYAHRTTLMRRKCVVAMEAQSRYAMLFTGLTKADFRQFPQLFRDRLVVEALSICQPNDQQAGKLELMATLVAEPIDVLAGYDRSVLAHINEVVRELGWMVQGVGALPRDDEDEFTVGLRVNQMLRRRKSDQDYFYPLQQMRGFWLGLLQRVTPPPGNVIPFRRPGRV